MAADFETETVSVLAVDDHPGFLEAARAVVEAAPGFRWAGEASCGEEAIRKAGQSRPDLVLADVNMPGMDGYELARRLRTSFPETLVALISAQHPDQLPRANGEQVLPKENLRPAWLREIWSAHLGSA